MITKMAIRLPLSVSAAFSIFNILVQVKLFLLEGPPPILDFRIIFSKFSFSWNNLLTGTFCAEIDAPGLIDSKFTISNYGLDCFNTPVLGDIPFFL